MKGWRGFDHWSSALHLAVEDVHNVDAETKKIEAAYAAVQALIFVNELGLDAAGNGIVKAMNSLSPDFVNHWFNN